MHFNDFTEDPLIDMPKWFPNVEEVSFVGDAKMIGNKTARLNQYFPSVRRMSLKLRNIQNQNCVQLFYPNLKHLYVIFSLPIIQFGGLNESTIVELIKRNPQLQSISIDFASLSFLNQVNDILPHLDTLSFDTIAEFFNYHEKIHFKYVRKLTIQAASDIIPTNVTFARLEEVQFESFRAFRNQ